MEFNKYSLKDISLNITDGVHNTVIDDPNGDCFLLSCKNIKNYHIVISENERTISHDTLLKLRNRTKTEKDDILITSVGTIGELSLIKDDNPNYEFQRSVAIIKPNKLIVIPEYLMYSLRNEMPQINSFVKGAVQKCLFINDLKQIVLKLPSLTNQKKIVQLLTCIDRKIELNNWMNNNLYEMQKQYYKKLFKDSIYQELRLNDLCEISAGGDAPKDKIDYKTDVYKFPIISNGVDNDGIYGYSQEFKIDKKSVTISARGTIGYKVLRNYNYYPIVRLISILPKDDIISAEYLFYALDDVQIFSTGTTQQQLTVPMVKDIKIKVYSYDLIKVFTNYSITMNNKIESNKEENETLMQLRDTLLPKLMNGEIDLDNIEI